MHEFETEILETENQELTLDTLFEMSLDHEADKKAAAEMQPPPGTYTTNGDWQVSTFTGGDGRPILSFFGTAYMGDNEVRTRYRLSPRKGVKDDGSVTFDFKLYLQAKSAYEQVMGEPPSTLGALVEYLTTRPVRLRLIRGDTDPRVVAIVPFKG